MSQDERKKVRKEKERKVRRQKESNMTRLINRKEVSRMAEGK